MCRTGCAFESMIKMLALLCIVLSTACSDDSGSEVGEDSGQARGDAGDAAQAMDSGQAVDAGQDAFVETVDSGAATGDAGDSADPLTTELDRLCDAGEPWGENIFVETDGWIVAEVEDGHYTGGDDRWRFFDTPAAGNESDTHSFSGAGYYEWVRDSKIPLSGTIVNNDIVFFDIYIQTPGVYLVAIRGLINAGNNNSEHNDAWLSVRGPGEYYAFRTIGGADQFAYPDEEDNKAGDRGFFKAYTKITDRWGYESKTVDFGDYRIYKEFTEPGLFDVRIAGRSRFFAIDQLVLTRDPDWNANRLSNRQAPVNQTDTQMIHRCN